VTDWLFPRDSFCPPLEDDDGGNILAVIGQHGRKTVASGRQAGKRSRPAAAPFCEVL
jgi:hypothetical protein